MDIDGLIADLPQRPLLPHRIIHVNDEGDEDLLLPLEGRLLELPVLQDEDVNELTNAHDPPLPVYGPSQILQVDLILTRLPSHWPVYSGLDYFDLDKEIQDEEMEEEEEEDLEEEETKEGPISITKRPISTIKQSLEDMIRSNAGGEVYIPTMGLQELSTTQVFAPTLETHFPHQ